MRYHKEYEGYRLDEVTRRTGIDETEILRMAARDELTLWVWLDSLQTTEGIEKPGWFKVNGKTAFRLASCDKIYVESFDTIDGRTIYPAFEDGLIVIPVVYAGMASLNPYDRHTGGEKKYFGSEEIAPEPSLIQGEIVVSRSSLNILLEDFEKLNGQLSSIVPGDSVLENKSALRLVAKNKVSKESRLRLLGAMVSLATSTKGFSRYKSQAKIYEEVCDTVGRDKKTIDTTFSIGNIMFKAGLDSQIRNDEEIDYFLIGSLVVVLKQDRPRKKVFMDIDDAILEITKESTLPRWADKNIFKDRIKLAVNELK